MKPIKKLTAALAGMASTMAAPFRPAPTTKISGSKADQHFERLHQNMMGGKLFSAPCGSSQSISHQEQFKNAKRRRAARGGRGTIRQNRMAK